jgi:hypothetical protein
VHVHDLERTGQRGPIRGVESRDPRISTRERHAIELGGMTRGDSHAVEVARGLEVSMGKHATQRAGLLGRKLLHDDDVCVAVMDQIRKGLGIGPAVHQIPGKDAQMGTHPASDLPNANLSTDQRRNLSKKAARVAA